MKMTSEKRDQLLRHNVEHFYDLQKLRIQSGNRDVSKTVELDEKDKAFMVATADGLKLLEKEALKEIKRYLAGHPVYEGWLLQQKGCGPTMSGVILSAVNMCRQVDPAIVAEAENGEPFVMNGATYFRLRYTDTSMAGQKFERNLLCFHRKGADGTQEVWEDCCPTVSSLWAYAGLSVNSQTGKAVRRTKGQKANWNPWLKAKMVKVLAESFIKCNSPWRKFYDDYKHRKQSQIGPCMLCVETPGKYNKKPCGNCDGTGRGPWGRSDAHRHQAALRYMMKMFLQELWAFWRELEGLPARAPYKDEYLDKVHHASA